MFIDIYNDHPRRTDYGYCTDYCTVCSGQSGSTHRPARQMAAGLSPPARIKLRAEVLDADRVDQPHFGATARLHSHIPEWKHRPTQGDMQ